MGLISIKCSLCGQFMSYEYGFFRTDIYGRALKNSEAAHCCYKCYENKMTDCEQNKWERISEVN